MLRTPWLAARRFLGFLVITSVAFPLFAAEDAGPEIIQLVVGLLGEKDKDLRSIGLEQVRSQAKGKAATEQFAANLSKLPAETQVGLLNALAERGDDTARPAIVELLAKSPDEPVRVAAISAVGFLGESANVGLLVQRLKEGATAEKTAARAALVRLPDAAVPKALADELTPAAPQVRVTLIEILKERRGLDAIPNLLAAAIEDDAAVRGAAMSALGDLASVDHLPGLVAGILKAEPGAERAAAEKATMLVCNRGVEAEKRAEPLLALMAKHSPADQTALLSTLGRVGGPAALRVVEEAIAAGDSVRHEAGLNALCNWPDASTAPRLIELTKADAHEEHRTAALKALIRVAPLPDKRPDAARLQLVKDVLAMCRTDAEKNALVARASAVRTIEMLRFLLPLIDQPAHLEPACLAVVELAHHRALREPNKAEFDQALDKVKATSKDATVLDRAGRYQRGETWVKPK